ncbi:DUF1905 domain-containing protein [Leucobacter zeae]|nr:DUF1905 domain-containing protein [Leucobacter zeae]
MSLRIDLELAPMGPATAIVLSDAQVEELGGGRRAAVLVTIGGRTARLRLARMGGLNCIGLSRAVRAELDVEIGDAVSALIELDRAERTVELPEDLAAALDADPRVRAAFELLPYTHRKEAARSVADAKRPETRERRIAAAVARAAEGLPGAGEALPGASN